MYKRKKHNKKIQTLLTVTTEECHGNAEKMVRKFIKKVKRDGILDEFRERTHFKKKTVERSEKKRKRKRLIEKHNNRQKELITTRGMFRSKPRRRISHGR